MRIPTTTMNGLRIVRTVPTRPQEMKALNKALKMMTALGMKADGRKMATLSLLGSNENLHLYIREITVSIDRLLHIILKSVLKNTRFHNFYYSD